jgi:hypothetical protein
MDTGVFFNSSNSIYITQLNPKMSTQIVRQNTLYIDMHQIPVLPQVEDVHVLIANTLPATVDNIMSLYLDTYKKHIYLKTISALVAERFLNHCGGHIAYHVNDVTYKLPMKLVEDDYITVTVVNVPFECTNEQLKQYFSTYGEIARIVQLTHAKHLLFPVDSGRRLVIYKRLPRNIPQHVELGGHKMRVSYAAQIKDCPNCHGNHLKYSCDQTLGDGGRRMDTSVAPPADSVVLTSFSVTTPSRKRLLSTELDDGNRVQDDKLLPSGHQDADFSSSIETDHSITVQMQEDVRSDIADAVSALVTETVQPDLRETHPFEPFGSGEQAKAPSNSLSVKEFPGLPTTDNLSPKGKLLLGTPPLPGSSIETSTSPRSLTASEVLQQSPSLTARASAMVSSFFSARPEPEASSTKPVSPSVPTVHDKKKTKHELNPKQQRTLRSGVARDKKSSGVHL